jgi:hypothetical protein
MMETNKKGANRITTLTIAVILGTVLTASTPGGAAAGTQDEPEEGVKISVSGKRLVFEVGRSSGPFDAYPDGTFAHESSGATIAFDEGEVLEFSGSDEETRAKVDRVEARDGKVMIYPGGDDRGLVSPNYVSLEDGTWSNRRAGTSFVVEDGRIIKCRGFEAMS